MKRIFWIFSMCLAVAVTTTSCTKEAGLMGENINGLGGEGNEGPNGEGNEGPNGEGGNESGMLWSCTETADEIVNGVRLILSYDAAAELFVGTLENLNTVIAPQARVEIHVFDAAGKSVEYGPTTPADMAPGEKRNVTLSVAGISDCFEFNMHPEIGSGASGEGNGGEGNEGTGSEGNGGEAGNESGLLWNSIDTADETVNGIRLKLAYDAATESFIGTLENINTLVAPQVRVEVHVFDAAGNSTEYGPTTPADMAPGEIRNVSLPVPGAGNFITFNMHPEVG